MKGLKLFVLLSGQGKEYKPSILVLLLFCSQMFEIGDTDLTNASVEELVKLLEQSSFLVTLKLGNYSCIIYIYIYIYIREKSDKRYRCTINCFSNIKALCKLGKNRFFKRAVY